MGEYTVRCRSAFRSFSNSTDRGVAHSFRMVVVW